METGDKVIFVDSEHNEPFVILPLSKYEPVSDPVAASVSVGQSAEHITQDIKLWEETTQKIMQPSKDLEMQVEKDESLPSEVIVNLENAQETGDAGKYYFEEVDQD